MCAWERDIKPLQPSVSATDSSSTPLVSCSHLLLVVSHSHSVIWQLAEELGALNEGVTIKLLFLHSNALALSYIIKHTYMCIEAIKHAKHIHTIQTDWGCGSKEVNTGGVSEMICQLVFYMSTFYEKENQIVLVSFYFLAYSAWNLACRTNSILFWKC